jgi:putative transposase
VKVAPKPMTLNQLVKRVCREEGVKEQALKTESRARHESQIRQTITYLAMELNVATLTAMAERFNRDLTTMSRNQRYYRDKLATDTELQKHVRAVQRKILAD